MTLAEKVSGQVLSLREQGRSRYFISMALKVSLRTVDRAIKLTGAKRSGEDSLLFTHKLTKRLCKVTSIYHGVVYFGSYINGRLHPRRYSVHESEFGRIYG